MHLPSFQKLLLDKIENLSGQNFDLFSLVVQEILSIYCIVIIILKSTVFSFGNSKIKASNNIPFNHFYNNYAIMSSKGPF